jgi:hypothetical protein
MGTVMGTLWERALLTDARLLNFQEEMARPNGFELPTPRFVVNRSTDRAIRLRSSPIAHEYLASCDCRVNRTEDL